MKAAPSERTTKPNLYQHYSGETFEKYICHLSNYLNMPRIIQINWQLQAFHFNDRRSHPIAWLSCTQRLYFWTVSTPQQTYRCTKFLTVRGTELKGDINIMGQTTQCRFVAWRKNPVALMRHRSLLWSAKQTWFYRMWGCIQKHLCCIFFIIVSDLKSSKIHYYYYCSSSIRPVEI